MFVCVCVGEFVCECSVRVCACLCVCVFVRVFHVCACACVRICIVWVCARVCEYVCASLGAVVGGFPPPSKPGAALPARMGDDECQEAEDSCSANQLHQHASPNIKTSSPRQDN